MKTRRRYSPGPPVDSDAEYVRSAAEIIASNPDAWGKHLRYVPALDEGFRTACAAGLVETCGGLEPYGHTPVGLIQANDGARGPRDAARRLFLLAEREARRAR